MHSYIPGAGCVTLRVHGVHTSDIGVGKRGRKVKFAIKEVVLMMHDSGNSSVWVRQG